MNGLYGLIFVCFVHVLQVNACDYLKFGKNHTMCTYTGAGCHLLKRTLSDADKVAIVKAHNIHRQTVANGKQSGQPGASNMKELVWNDELANIAQRWADQCAKKHDANRRTQTYSDVGQNVVNSWSSPPSPVNVNNAVQSWYDEVIKPGFDPRHISPFQYSSGAGHYTQVVWADTEAVGCGYSSYIKDGMTANHVVCNYGPGGNMKNAIMYKTGAPCSQCNGKKCSTTYPGLCA